MTEVQSTPDYGKRNVLVLLLAQAILGSQMPIQFTLGGLSGQILASNPCWATLPITLIVLGSALTAPVLGQVMHRYGRLMGFYIGVLGGALGAIFCAAGLWFGSFGLFLFGSLLTGIYMSAQGFYRFAATDLASDDFRPKAISWVMAGGLLAAIIGPQLVKVTQGAISVVPFIGSYLAIIGLNAVGALVFLLYHNARPKEERETAYTGRTRMQMLRSPRILVAMICAMVSYALMSLVMTSTPLAVVGCGYGTERAADVVSAHVLAMFVPSFFTGHLIARFGTTRIMATGLVILVAAGFVGLAGIELEHFFGALILLGIGWNFGFIGATNLLAASHTAEERGRIQGLNDFAVFGLVTVASASSGALMNCSGGTPQQGWYAVNLAMVPFLVLAGGALVWLTVRGSKLAS